MSTVDHLIAQCGQLRTAWVWLAEATIPGRARRNQRTLTESATAKRDQQAAAERADRQKLLGNGKLVTGHEGAPANVNAIDARDTIAKDINHAALAMAWHMRSRKYNVDYRSANGDVDHRFRNDLNWISTNAPRLQDGDQANIKTTHRALGDATKLATAVSGARPEYRPLAAECPACGRRSLAWIDSSERREEHHIKCTNPKCRCSGRSCGCNQPDRQFGASHVWLQSTWERLAQQINQEVK